MTVAGAYCRKSNDEGERDPDAKSVARQQQGCRDYAVKKGWRLDDRHVYVDDAVSGAVLPEKRPGFAKLLADLNRKPAPFQALIVSEDSRLGRFEDERELAAITLLINKAGVKIFGYADDEEIGRGVKSMFKGYSASEERRRGSQRTKGGMATAHRLGKSVGGRLFGYRTVPTGKIVQLPGGKQKVETRRVIDRAQARVVQQIFERRAQGWGRTTLQRFLNGHEVTLNGRKHKRDPVPSPRAGSRTNRRDETGNLVKAKAGGRWSGAQLNNIFRNAHYVGKVTWDGDERVDEGLRIVPDKLFREVQRINDVTPKHLRRPDGKVISRPSGKHWATQYLRCGVCGTGSMYIRHEKTKKGVHTYLFCSRRNNGGAGGPCSNARRLPIAKAEREIIEKFTEAIEAATVVAHLGDWIRARREAKQLGRVDRQAAERERAEFVRQRDNLLELAKRGGDFEVVKRGIADLNEKIEGADAQLKASNVLADVDLRMLKDGIDAVKAGWEKQIKKRPEVLAQVLGKLIGGQPKIKVTPDPSRHEWKFEAEVDYTPLVREVDQEVADVIEALGRELELDPKAIKQLAAKRENSGARG